MIDQPKSNYLYYGSANKNLEILNPPIYASESEAIASQFIVTADSDWSLFLNFHSIDVAVYGDIDKFMSRDLGGAIYTLSGDEFNNQIPIKPISKKVFPSGFDAMLSRGVQVYFVTPAQLSEIKNASDHGLSILKTLPSENFHWQKNYKAL